MAMRILFGALALGLLVVAIAAWRGGQPIVAIGAAVIAVWMASMTIGRRGRTRR